MYRKRQIAEKTRLQHTSPSTKYSFGLGSPALSPFLSFAISILYFAVKTILFCLTHMVTIYHSLQYACTRERESKQRSSIFHMQRRRFQMKIYFEWFSELGSRFWNFIISTETKWNRKHREKKQKEETNIKRHTHKRNVCAYKSHIPIIVMMFLS